jgi:hypothetical protein
MDPAPAGALSQWLRLMLAEIEARSRALDESRAEEARRRRECAQDDPAQECGSASRA